MWTRRIGEAFENESEEEIQILERELIQMQILKADIKSRDEMHI